jgi:hypothetical protein
MPFVLVFMPVWLPWHATVVARMCTRTHKLLPGLSSGFWE